MLTPTAPQFVQVPAAAQRPAAEELQAGLLAPAAHIAPKFLYDRLGSLLFKAITALDEYYPTRTEAAIWAAHGPALAAELRAVLPPRYAMVDLGSGDGAKAASLFPLLEPAHHVAVDISADFLRDALAGLARRHPQMRFTGVGLDFAHQLALPAGLLDGPALVFYPGSSIGNFSPAEALAFLRQARELAAGGALLIGADLVKPRAVLEAAYDDALGVTAAFNLNLLRHVNRLLGSDFNPAQWQHQARYGAEAGRIEMHLCARQALQVRWPGGSQAFDAGERIHTENSHKWRASAFEALLQEAGWRDVRCWCDEQAWFGVFTARA